MRLQVLCKAIKKPTNFDISTAVKQEMTFDVEAQQQEQLQQLQQQQRLLQQQPALAAATAAGGTTLPGYLPETPQAAPETFAAAAYGRGRSGFPQWAIYVILVGVAVLCSLILCCCLFCKRF